MQTEILNKEQLEAVNHLEGSLLIVAGAGSGKTLTITYRIANLIKQKIAFPDEILGVTFTNKAAGEMKERVNNLISANVRISTFHSFCAMMLRRHIDKLAGYSQSFSIYDDSDQKILIRNVLNKLNMDNEKGKISEACSKISRLKEDLVEPDQYANFAANPYEKDLCKVYVEYQEELIRNNAVDFSDLIFLTVKLYKQNPDILSYYQEKYKYILVDEYQDTNYSQYELIRMLADKYKNICVVGDPDQSIYAWRGADISNILNFEKDYPKTKVIKLEQNYRSTNMILESSNKVIEKNLNRMPKNLRATKPGGEKLSYFQGSDARDEADFISQKIKSLNQRGRSLKDIAVFYRMHALSRSLEESLISDQISYEIVGGTKFYDRKEIKDILAYLRCIVNPACRVSFERIINIPKRKIGKSTIAKLFEFSLANELSYFDTLKRQKEIAGIPQAARNSIDAFVYIIEKYYKLKANTDVVNIVKDLIEDINYVDYLKEYDIATFVDRESNVEELVSSIAEYQERTGQTALVSYLEHISLISSIDSFEQKEDKVTLMTLHNAKGLEFDTVFIVALEEGVFPHTSSFNDLNELEEERRLCYVGMTRAKEKLFLTSASSRLIYGRWAKNTTSRFVKDIPYSNIIVEKGIFFAQPDYSFKINADKKNINIPKKTAKGYLPEIQSGQKVFHEMWGIGEILERKGSSEADTSVKVNFERVSGCKNLLLKYAKLSVVDN